MSLKALAKKFGDTPLYIVGGAVRNMLLGVEPKDIDITAAMRAEDVISMLEGSEFCVVPSSLRMGTLIIRDGRTKYEYTAFRTDSYIEGSGEHTPIAVKFTDDINIDAMRRDFRVNAIYYDVLGDKYVDPLGGMADIKARVLRTTRDAEDVFSEDGLRLLRLVRFASQLGFCIEPHCYSVAKSLVHLLRDISVERITEEFNKILVADTSGYGNRDGHYEGIKMLIDMGAMDYIVPELMVGKDFPQNAKYHMYDVLTHEVEAMHYADANIRLVALLHDIGKPYEMMEHGNMHRHPDRGAVIVRDVLTRLKYPNKVIDEVSTLTKIHMFATNNLALDRTIRKFIVTNHELMDKFLLLRIADIKSSRKSFDAYHRIKRIYEDMKARHVPMSIGELKVNGNDIKAKGITGARIGEVLSMLLDKVALDGVMNEREELLKYVRGEN